MQARNPTNVKGIDVSHHQGVIDWKKVAADGVKFAYVKATQNSIDKRFRINVKEAAAAGILVGAYHYLDKYVTTADLAKKAAQEFYQAILLTGAKELTLPPALDYEEFSGIDSPQINIIAKAFLVELKNLTGVTPIIYTGNSFADKFDKSLSIYPIWIARYSSNVPWDVPAWPEWEIWQYTSEGKVNGITGNVDTNAMELKFFNSLLKPITPKPPVIAPTAPTPSIPTPTQPGGNVMEKWLLEQTTEAIKSLAAKGKIDSPDLWLKKLQSGEDIAPLAIILISKMK